MKGTLHKTEQGWIVEYAKHSELPLHPDDESLWMFAELNEEWKDKLDGKEVEFDIVSDTYEKPGKGNTYAKLIPSKEQQKQLITEIMDLDAKDGLYEISDEEIEKFASDFYGNNGSESIFIMGAKWQADRSYSEEDMRKAFEAGELSKEDDINGDGETLFDEWFEQHKKK
jgi:hypothetical protein